MRPIGKISLLATLLWHCSVGLLPAAELHGRVTASGKPLAGVAVTDGHDFARTDDRGVWTLDAAREAEFVSVVTPSGYVAPFDSGSPEFYLRIEQGRETYDFALEPYGRSDGYVLAAIGDPQVQTERHMGRFRNETVADLAAFVANEGGNRVTAIALGDIVWDNMGLFADYKRAVATLGVPVYPVIGNHDYDKDRVNDCTAYKSCFGPTWYAFDLGGEHFVVLNNIVYNTDKRYEERITPEQFAWLKRYVALLEKGSRINICMHAMTIHIGSGTKELAGICKGHTVSFLTGHSHLNSNFDVLPGITEHNVASCGGAWWSSEGFGKDGCPMGYQVFERDNGVTSWYFKVYGHDRNWQIELFDRGAFPRRPNAVVAKIWNWDPQWRVEWREDGREMGVAARFDDYDPNYLRHLQRRRDEGKGEPPSYKRAVKSFFYFAAVPGASARTVEFVATDRFGRQYRSSIELGSLK